MTARSVRRFVVDSDGVSLHVEEWGAGATPVVLGHGFGGSARNFRPQARALSVSHRVILFDARGHARSSAPSDATAYAPDCFVADLGRVLDAVGAKQAVVGGLSMGAGVALRFTLAHPDRVVGLWLSAFPRPRSAPGHLDWALAFARDLDAEGIERAGERHAWGTRLRSDPKGADLVRRGFLEHGPGALAHVLRSLIALQPAPVELADELGQVAAPTSVLVGSDDLPSLGPSRDLARLIPGARLFEVPGGHIINLENPSAYNAALEELLAAAGA